MRMKIIILVAMLLVGLQGCDDNEPTEIKPVYPINDFIARSVVIQTEENLHLMEGSDCQNIRFWIKSSHVRAIADADISDDWTYMLIFSDGEVTNIDGNLLFPYTSRLHYVYINTQSNIIQFDNTSYYLSSVNEADRILFEGIEIYCGENSIVETGPNNPS